MTAFATRPLSALPDVQLTGLADGDLLNRAAGKWKNAHPGQVVLAPGATVLGAPAASANAAALQLGAPFDGVTTGFFVGDALGTFLGIDAASGYAGSFADYQKAGVSQYAIKNHGSVRTPLFFQGNSRDLVNADVPNFTAIVGAPDYFVGASRAGAGAGTYWYSDANVFFMAPGGIFGLCTNVSNGAPYMQLQLADTTNVTLRDGSSLGAAVRQIGARTVNLWGGAANTGTGTANRIFWSSGQAAPVAGTRLLSIGWTNNTSPQTYTETAAFLQQGILQLTGLTTGTPNERAQYQEVPSWVDAADSTRKARIVFQVWDTAAREGLRLEASGAAPMIGFLGAAAVVRPTVTGAKGGNAALASLLTQLVSLGLVLDTTSA
jgi:hypothetical protein